MPQVFHRSANDIARGSIIVVALVVVGILVMIALLYRSTYATEVGVPIEQPIQFSHEHHVGGLGIDCRYCHPSVENSTFAGIPPTQTCMNCHSQIWTQAPILAPVRESWQTGTPIQWNRVHNLPQFTHFNHSIHIQKGVGCETCHGRVDQMPLMWKAETLSMSWCLDCHRDPAKYVRPREEVFTMGYQPPGDQYALGRALVEEYGVRSLTSCSTCHY